MGIFTSGSIDVSGSSEFGSHCNDVMHVTGTVRVSGSLEIVECPSGIDAITLKDGGSLKESGGTAAFTFDGSGHVTKIGQDSPSSGQFLKWDGNKAVWDAASGEVAGSVALDNITAGDSAANLYNTHVINITNSAGNIIIDSSAGTLIADGAGGVGIQTAASVDGWWY